ncbi:MAG: hypothetical protein SOX70_05570 [Peptoniphilaceae bacterium]|nr:hypothetical protein [Peptoniphilaceae bacterium]
MKTIVVIGKSWTGKATGIQFSGCFLFELRSIFHRALTTLQGHGGSRGFR